MDELSRGFCLLSGFRHPRKCRRDNRKNFEDYFGMLNSQLIMLHVTYSKKKMLHVQCVFLDINRFGITINAITRSIYIFLASSWET